MTGLATGTAGGGPIEWHGMSEPERELAWAELRAWAAWLTGRYRLHLEDRLPGCWPQHPELIEELAALKAWRVEAYGAEGTGQQAVYWHQALVTFLTHTATWWASGCRAGHKTALAPVSPERERRWAAADPLTGVPPDYSTIAAQEQEGADAMSAITMITEAQMRALTDVGKAHPLHDTVAAFTYYDGDWWVHATDARRGPQTGVWLRTTEDDLAADPTFRLDPPAAA